MIILVDMDGVIADFEKGFLDNYRRLHPNKPYVPLEKRTVFHTKNQYPKELHPIVESVYQAPGFYLSLPVIEGSIEAMLEISKKHDVFICTSPLSKYENCVLEKYKWVEKNLGKEWVKKIIVAKDKTLVSGGRLIDDNPKITGVKIPEWEHIIYDQPYNRSENSKRRINWKNWKSVLNM